MIVGSSQADCSHSSHLISIFFVCFFVLHVVLFPVCVVCFFSWAVFPLLGRPFPDRLPPDHEKNRSRFHDHTSGPTLRVPTLRGQPGCTCWALSLLRAQVRRALLGRAELSGAQVDSQGGPMSAERDSHWHHQSTVWWHTLVSFVDFRPSAIGPPHHF